LFKSLIKLGYFYYFGEIKGYQPIEISTLNGTGNSSFKGKIRHYYYGWCTPWDLSAYSKNGD
jgi:hypothetical protein